MSCYICVTCRPTKPPPRFMQEGFDLREQARWKLERAVEAAIAAKRWDAAGVAAFALAEVLGGDDSPAAVGALMLHQVCQLKPKLQTHSVLRLAKTFWCL